MTSQAYQCQRCARAYDMAGPILQDCHIPSRCDYVSGLSSDCATYRKRLLLRMRNREGWLIRIVITGEGCYGCRTESPADTDTYQYQGRSGDWHKYRRTIVQAYYYAPMRVCAYEHMRI